ncbi:MAG: hypothetical protein GF311_18465 [Candidatus Lokiarchaeota archaeon]|nr:hypothetical protein [Candidatus Lokiarchaeota archaeon]
MGLNPISNSVFIFGKTIAEILHLTVKELLSEINRSHLISFFNRIIKEIRKRLEILTNIGVRNRVS